MLALFLMPLQAQETDAMHEDVPYYLTQVTLTKDLNVKFFEVWQVPLFEELAKCDSRIIKIMYVSMKNLKIPVDNAAMENPGVYEDEKLQTLYDRLMEEASASSIDALKASAEMEERQLLFLETALMRSENIEAILLYDRFRIMSKSNLRTIAGVLLDEGITYRPVVMSNDYFDNQVMSQAQPVF